MPRDRAAKLFLDTAIAAAVAALAAATTGELWRFATAARELPLWDEAKYGLDGARLTAALLDLDLGRFAALVHGLDVWPPLFPLLESIVFLATGNGFAAARALLVVLFFAAVLATFWAGREIAPGSPGIGAAAAALLLASPFVQLFGAHAMLEIPGALLYLLALGAYARFLRNGGRGALIATGLSSAALFFTKYNYALLWLAPLVASEAWIACGGPRAALRQVGALAGRFDPRRPWHLFVALYLAGLAAIAATGGGSLAIAGTEVSVTSIGNPLHLLVLLLSARWALRPRRSWRRFREWEQGLAERHRVLLWTVAAPAAAWLVLPPHLRGLVEFVENRSSGPPLGSAAWLLFYPRVFVEEYHAEVVVGAVVLVLALTAIARLRSSSPPARVLLLALLVGLAAATLHPYKEPRFLLVVAPVAWLAAAWNAGTLAERAAVRVAGSGRAAPARRWTSPLIAIAAVVALEATAGLPALAPGLGQAFARHTVPASSVAFVDRIVELAAERPTLVLGTWNQASPALVEWRFRQLHREAAPLPELMVPASEGGSAAGLERRLAGARAPAQVVVLDLASGDGGTPEWEAAFVAETAWLAPVRDALSTGELPYALAAEERFPGTGTRLLLYRALTPVPSRAATAAE